ATDSRIGPVPAPVTSPASASPNEVATSPCCAPWGFGLPPVPASNVSGQVGGSETQAEVPSHSDSYSEAEPEEGSRRLPARLSNAYSWRLLMRHGWTTLARPFCILS
ncbi:hypothetical protein Vafri_11334, partial [Volvox africanus]